MVGISSYGVYIPWHRLERAQIARAWGQAPLPGERAVANYDEDSVTMAVAACLDCVTDVDTSPIGTLYFASTTFPYKEKQSAAIIATAIDLGEEAFTLDLGDSLRGGTSSVSLGLDAINAKTTKNALVCAADIRLGFPNGAKEMDFGDGAAALLLSDNGVIATVDGAYHS